MDTHYRAILPFTLVLILNIDGAIVPPPWANPGNNPCASQPGGWQLLYWPLDGKCYKIFHKGYPCPDSMELTPGSNMTAECKCPPGSAQNPQDSLCHRLYSTAPCKEGEYFAPMNDYTSNYGNQRQRWGACVEVEPCPKAGTLFWPREGRCYTSYIQGPCPDGQLLAPGYANSPIGECLCDNNGRMGRFYWTGSGTCHEHYTPGPCQEKGMLFLPDGKCGCHSGLQQYHHETKQCYQIGTVGPCLPGHHFIQPKRNVSGMEINQARCVCKDGHILWEADGVCYRPFTRGPCQQGEMYNVNYNGGNTTVSCVPVPCPAGRLYFPGGKGCHRVGTQGPCPPGQVVLFQDSVKTSVEGISYQGMCGCAISTNDPQSFYPTLRADNRATHTDRCISHSRRDDSNNGISPPNEARGNVVSTISGNNCGLRRGMITWSDNTCQQLYTQGPCKDGEWVVPDRGRGQRRGRSWKLGKCDCRTGYVTFVNEKTGEITCQPPTVRLARFLNSEIQKNYTLQA